MTALGASDIGSALDKVLGVPSLAISSRQFSSCFHNRAAAPMRPGTVRPQQIRKLMIFGLGCVGPFHSLGPLAPWLLKMSF